MINQSKINLLNKLILQIKNSGIFPIVIFEPTGFNSEIRYVKNDFKRIINSEILHLVNFKVDMYALWADKSHFNVHGRREYTEQLIKEFIKLSKRNIS